MDQTTFTSGSKSGLELSLERIARGKTHTLASVLDCVESAASLDGTNVLVHTHFVRLDANGRPRVNDLVSILVDKVTDYAIPRSKIKEAKEQLLKTGSTEAITRLANQARKKFTSIKTSGEGGELLIFALAEEILSLPQLFCKMSVKTSSDMHVHGSDGVHAGVGKTPDTLALYWCESKLYADFSSAVSVCLGDLGKYLLASGTEASALTEDLQLLDHHLDLADPEIEKAIRAFLKDMNKVEMRGLGLVGFDYDKYPDKPNAITHEALGQEILTQLEKWKERVKTVLKTKKIESFHIHFFVFPSHTLRSYARRSRVP